WWRGATAMKGGERGRGPSGASGRQPPTSQLHLTTTSLIPHMRTAEFSKMIRRALYDVLGARYLSCRGCDFKHSLVRWRRETCLGCAAISNSAPTCPPPTRDWPWSSIVKPTSSV